MSNPTGQTPEPEPDGPESPPNDSQAAIRNNLNNFLNPGLPLPQNPAEPNGALQLRMAQMELANKMRLNSSTPPPNAVPMRFSPPPGGFGSAQGVFHMQRGDFGKPKPKPSAGKPSPYQQIFAQASAPSEPSKEPEGEEILEVPEGSEVRQDEKPKRLKGKRFKNPSL